MKVDELIKELQELRDRFGNVKVEVRDDEACWSLIFELEYIPSLNVILIR